MIYRNKHYKLAVVFGTAFWVMLLTGCGQMAPFEPTPEPVTLTVVYPGNDQDFFEGVVEEFNQEYPHITINHFSPGAGESPDVIVITSFAVNGLVDDASIIPVDPLIEQEGNLDLDDIYPGVLNLFTRDGKTWAVPVGLDLLVVYYNQDLFDQYNVPYPDMNWTWGDFLEKAQALRDPGMGTFGFLATGDPNELVTFIYQNDGGLFDDINNPSQITFNNPLNVGALEWYLDLIYYHDVAPTSLQRLEEWGSSSMSVGIVSNKVGMWIDGFFDRGSVLGNIQLPMRWGVVPLPTGARPLTFATPVGYAISAETDYVDAALQWIIFLSKYPLDRLIPARISVMESDEYAKLAGGDAASVARVSLERSFFLDGRVLFQRYQQELGILMDAIQQAYEGEITAQEALNQAQEQAENLNP